MASLMMAKNRMAFIILFIIFGNSSNAQSTNKIVYEKKFH